MGPEHWLSKLHPTAQVVISSKHPSDNSKTLAWHLSLSGSPGILRNSNDADRAQLGTSERFDMLHFNIHWLVVPKEKRFGGVVVVEVPQSTRISTPTWFARWFKLICTHCLHGDHRLIRHAMSAGSMCAHRQSISRERCRRIWFQLDKIRYNTSIFAKKL